MKTLILTICFGSVLPVLAQQAQPTEPIPEDAPITGGVVYRPEVNTDEALRDPFKSPFEIEQDDRDQKQVLNPGSGDEENRLPYSISELDLRGIYYQAQSGYRAIFRVGEEYKWWPAGTKFQDADMVNITDGAVIFKHYASDDETHVREVVKELHRGEE